MNATVEIINAMGRAFVGFALPMLVQSSLLILILLAADIAMRRRVRAVFRYWIWMLVLAKLVLPPSLGSPVSIGRWFGDPLRAPTAAVLELGEPQADAPPAEPRSIATDIFAQTTAVSITATAPAVENAPVAEPYVPADVDSKPMPGVTVMPPAQTPIPSLQWQALVLLSWAAVAAALLLLLLQRAFFVRGLVAQADEASAVMQETLARCRRHIGLRSEVALKLSAIADSPAACGLIRPVILIPQSLAPRLELHDLQAVLLHELAHIKRGDLRVSLVQTMLQIVYFYNPLLWLANMTIRRIREQAVDEAVLVAMGDAAQQYPETLVNIAKLAFRKRPGLSLRLVGVVESKSALAARIRHILTRPLPTTARLGMLGLIVVCVTAAVLLPMAKAATQDRPFSVEGGPLDIQLVAVRPDAGDEYYDPAGNKLDWTAGVLNTRMDQWDARGARRDFIFKLPDTNEPALFGVPQHIHVAGQGAIRSGGIRPMGLHDGSLLYILPTMVPRSRPSDGKLSRVLSASSDVCQVDLTLRYFYGPPQDPICTFTGPFEAGGTFAADGNLPYQLTCEKLGSEPVHTFRLNLPAGLVADDDVPVLIYDTDGKRHYPAPQPLSKTTYVLLEGPLERVAKITIGEKAHERVFRNVVVGYPRRPARSCAAYLDQVAKILNLEKLPKNKLAQYHFRTPQEAIAVLDIIQGGELTRLAVEAITYGKPPVELSSLDEPTRDKVHSVAQKWAASFDLDMRSRGVQLGLLGPWPEFFDQAITLLQDDYHYMPGTDSVVSDLGQIVWLLLNRWRDRLTKDQYDSVTSFYNGRRVFPVLALADRGIGGGTFVDPGEAAVKLANGVAVRFMAYSQLTSDGLKWWTSAGEPTKIPGIYEADVDGLGTVLAFEVNPPDSQVYAQIYRGSEKDIIKKSWGLPNSDIRLFALGEQRNFANVEVTTRIVEPPVVGLIPLTREDQGTVVDVSKFGIDKIVDLQVLSTGTSTAKQGAETTESSPYGVAYGATFGPRANLPVIQFTVLPSPGSYPQIVALWDREGLTYALVKNSGNARATTYEAYISLDRLVDVVVEASPVRESNARFRNISLTPGHATTVQVEADPKQQTVWEYSKVALGIRVFVEGLEQYQRDHGGRLPASLQGMKAYLHDENFSWLTEHIAYIGRGGLPTNEPNVPIAYDKTLLPQGKGTYVIYDDRRVQFESPKCLKELGIATPEERTVDIAPAASLPTLKPAPIKPVRLANGVTVDLLAYSRLGTAGLEWWTPQGLRTTIPSVHEADVEGHGSLLALRMEPTPEAGVRAWFFQPPDIRYELKPVWRVNDSDIWLMPLGEGRSYANVEVTIQVRDPVVLTPVVLKQPSSAGVLEIGQARIGQITDVERVDSNSTAFTVQGLSGFPSQAGPELVAALDTSRQVHSVRRVPLRPARGYGPLRGPQRFQADMPVDQFAGVVVEGYSERAGTVKFGNLSLLPGQPTEVYVDVAAQEQGPWWHSSGYRSKLGYLGRVLSQYAEENGGRYPADLSVLRAVIDDEQWQWLQEHTVYLGAGKSSAQAGAVPLAYEKTLLSFGFGTYVLFSGPDVSFQTPSELKRLGIATSQARGTEGAADATQTISGVVVAPDGRPIPEAFVAVENEDLLLLPEPVKVGSRMRRVMREDTVRTDSTGRFAFTGLNPGATDLRVWADGHRKESLQAVATGTTGLRVVLGEPLPPRPFIVSGVVVDERGAGLGEVSVTCVETHLSADRGQDDPPVTVRTDAAGAFRFNKTFEPVDPRVVDRTLIVRKRGYGLWNGRVDAAGEENSLRITLPPEEKVSGTVVNEAGEPIANAKVSLLSCWRRGEMFFIQPKRRALGSQVMTGPDGSFTLEQLPTESDLFLEVSASGYASGESPHVRTGTFGSYGVQRTDGRTDFMGRSDTDPNAPLKIVLQRAVTLRGTVVYEDTAKPAGAIRVATQHDRGEWSETLTNGAGRFEMNDISPTPCNVLAMVEDADENAMPDWTAAAVTLGDLKPGQTRDGIKLVLTKGGIVRGKVTDSQGHPLKGMGIGSHSAARPESGGAIQSIRSRADGTWVYRFPPGDVYIYVDKFPSANWQTDRYRYSLSAGQVIDGVDFTLDQVVPEDSPYQSAPARGDDADPKPTDPARGNRANPPEASKRISGVLVDPNGKPVAGAQVAVSTDKIEVLIRDGILEQPRTSDAERGPLVETDAEGRFRFESKPVNDFDLIAAHASGFAKIASDEFSKNREIRLERWGRIEGQAVRGRLPREDRMSMSGLPNPTWLKHNLEFRYETDSDSEGKFAFQKVPAGRFEVGCTMRTGDSFSSITSRTPVEVKSGQTAQMKVGGEGRPVIGRFVPPANYNGPAYLGAGVRALQTSRPAAPRPASYDQMTNRQKQQWSRQWWQTPEARAYSEAIWSNPDWRAYAFQIENDGSFRIEDVIPGKYDMTVYLEEELRGQDRPEEIGGYTGTIEVPPMTQAYTEEPLNVGDLVLKIHRALHVGGRRPAV